MKRSKDAPSRRFQTTVVRRCADLRARFKFRLRLLLVSLFCTSSHTKPSISRFSGVSELVVRPIIFISFARNVVRLIIIEQRRRPTGYSGTSKTNTTNGRVNTRVSCFGRAPPSPSTGLPIDFRRGGESSSSAATRGRRRYNNNNNIRERARARAACTARSFGPNRPRAVGCV